jgi:hypothetical protein
MAALSSLRNYQRGVLIASVSCMERVNGTGAHGCNLSYLPQLNTRVFINNTARYQRTGQIPMLIIGTDLGSVWFCFSNLFLLLKSRTSTKGIFFTADSTEAARFL